MLKRLKELEELYARHYHNLKEDFKVALYTFIQIGKAISEQNYNAMLELKDREEEYEREGVKRCVLIVTHADAVHMNRRDWLDAVKLATEHVVDGKDETLEKALKVRGEAKKSYFIENKTLMNEALSVLIEAVNYYRDERNESRRVKQSANTENSKQC